MNDGAAYMQKACHLLKLTQQHCIVYNLLLLLMTDSINTLTNSVDLFNRCKSAVQRLYSECYLITDSRLKLSGSKVIESIQEKLSRVQEILEADERIIPSLPADNDDDNDAVQQIAIALGTDCGLHHNYEHGCDNLYRKPSVVMEKAQNDIFEPVSPCKKLFNTFGIQRCC